MDWTDLIGPGLGVLGGYLGAQAGGPQTQTTTLPPEMMGQWNAYTQFANTLANRPYQSGVAPMTQDQYGAMDQIRQQAGGIPSFNTAQNTLNTMLTQDNPYLKGMIQQQNDEVQNRMGTGAFASGSFGNSGVAKQTADALAQSTNQLQNTDLNRRAALIPQALGFQQQALGNSSALLQSGAQQQAFGQRMLDDYMQYPYRQLQTMGSPLGFAQGQQTTVQGNPWASALGGGLLGLQFGNAFMPPTQQVR